MVFLCACVSCSCFYPSRGQGLTATHTVTAIQTFVTGAAAYCYVAAGVTGRCIALHTFSCSIYGVHWVVCFLYRGGAVCCFYRLWCSTAQYSYFTQFRFTLPDSWSGLIPLRIAQVLYLGCIQYMN